MHTEQLTDERRLSTKKIFMNGSPPGVHSTHSMDSERTKATAAAQKDLKSQASNNLATRRPSETDYLDDEIEPWHGGHKSERAAIIVDN